MVIEKIFLCNEFVYGKSKDTKRICEKPMNDGQYLHTEIKCSDDKNKTDFNKKSTRRKISLFLLAKILDSVCKIKSEDDKYYQQMYLEESKYK